MVVIVAACNNGIDEEATLANAAGSGGTVIAGSVVLVSDVMNMPDMPASMGTVVAIGSERWRELSDAIGPAAIEPQRAQFGFRKEWTDFIEARGEIDDQGRWSLELDPGDYVLCIGNLAGPAPAPESHPISVTGCLAPLNVSAGITTLDLYVGELGLTGRLK